MSGFPAAVNFARALIAVIATAPGDGADFANRTNAQELLEVVRAGNKSALQSIRTLSCRINVASPVSAIGPPMTASTADYWQSGDSWRVRCSVSGQAKDTVRHDDVMRRLFVTYGANNEERMIFAISSANPDEPHPRFDALGRALLRLFGPNGCPLTLEELLSREHKLGKISRQQNQGHECIVVEMSIRMQDKTDGNFEIWFDPKFNYLACKLIGDFESSSSKPKVRRESQVLQFAEPSPGIYFPVETETRFYKDGKLTHHDVMTLSDIRVNESLPPNIFELRIPPNAKVLDAIQDREYQVDSQAKVLGPERSLPRATPIPLGSAQTETATEPTSITGWFVYGFLVVLAVAGGIWYFRRLRAAGD